MHPHNPARVVVCHQRLHDTCIRIVNSVNSVISLPGLKGAPCSTRQGKFVACSFICMCLTGASNM
jgi:hypothetical protein